MMRRRFPNLFPFMRQNHKDLLTKRPFHKLFLKQKPKPKLFLKPKRALGKALRKMNRRRPFPNLFPFIRQNHGSEMELLMRRPFPH